MPVTRSSSAIAIAAAPSLQSACRSTVQGRILGLFNWASLTLVLDYWDGGSVLYRSLTQLTLLITGGYAYATWVPFCGEQNAHAKLLQIHICTI